MLNLNLLPRDNPLNFAGLVLFILISGCSPKENASIEIVTSPTFPKELSSIPESSTSLRLEELSESEKYISTFSIGRSDPFLPPSIKENQKSLPATFIYYGQLTANNKSSAFVSFNDQSGSIYTGDIGGETTNLLPKGWRVENIDISSETLMLSKDNDLIDLQIFKNEP